MLTPRTAKCKSCSTKVIRFHVNKEGAICTECRNEARRKKAREYKKKTTPEPVK